MRRLKTIVLPQTPPYLCEPSLYLFLLRLPVAATQRNHHREAHLLSASREQSYLRQLIGVHHRVFKSKHSILPCGNLLMRQCLYGCGKIVFPFDAIALGRCFLARWQCIRAVLRLICRRLHLQHVTLLGPLLGVMLCPDERPADEQTYHCRPLTAIGNDP